MAAQIKQPLSTVDLADIACFSPYHFNRIFRSLTGVPPMRFLYALRMERAKRLLIDTSMSVTEICFESGYNSLGTFVTRFNQLVGVSPTSFRRWAWKLSISELKTPSDRLDAFAYRPNANAIIRGQIGPADFSGRVLVGLFRRAIPEAAPVACAIVENEDCYELAAGGDGRWYVFALGLPWSMRVTRLLMLDDLPRGRSGEIEVKDGRVCGNTSVTLAPPDVLHPPILAALPLVIH